MARWRREDTGRIEAPEWYRNFHLEAWDEPDAQEQRMIDGCPSMRPWPEDVHRWHAERRWGQAKHRYALAHPALAEQEFTDLIESFREDRRRESGEAHG
jgi:hypothetical protein